jgi:hypothetical protein
MDRSAVAQIDIAISIAASVIKLIKAQINACL